MRGSGVFWPLSLPVLVVLGLLLAVMAGTLVYAYERIGIDRSWLLALLGLSIVGSTVNLPVARLRSSVVLGPQVIRVYGIRYLVPAVRQRRVTVIAVNVGGALVPAGVAAFLIAHEHLGTRALVAVGIVAAVCLLLARPGSAQRWWWRRKTSRARTPLQPGGSSGSGRPGSRNGNLRHWWTMLAWATKTSCGSRGSAAAKAPMNAW